MGLGHRYTWTTSGIRFSEGKEGDTDRIPDSLARRKPLRLREWATKTPVSGDQLFGPSLSLGHCPRTWLVRTKQRGICFTRRGQNLRFKFGGPPGSRQASGASQEAQRRKSSWSSHVVSHVVSTKVICG